MGDSHRERIIAEVIKRAKAIDETGKTPVKRGFAGVEIQQFPSVYLFEGLEKYNFDANKGRGMYTVSFPIDIELFVRAKKGEEYALANQELEKLRVAFETDLRFTDSNGKDLCVSFGLDEVELFLFRDAIIDISARYIFRYVTRHKGS